METRCPPSLKRVIMEREAVDRSSFLQKQIRATARLRFLPQATAVSARLRFLPQATAVSISEWFKNVSDDFDSQLPNAITERLKSECYIAISELPISFNTNELSGIEQEAGNIQGYSWCFLFQNAAVCKCNMAGNPYFRLIAL
ncbi:hypothetical protein L1887_36223 [Cichorium endivia]|nr:hypothetical protein L1887_36223 [Cichorium endivia]